MTLRTVLLSLQALLAAAEPDDPQDAVVANQYKDNYEMFCKTAKVKNITLLQFVAIKIKTYYLFLALD